MRTISLSRPEFLVLVDALGGSAIIGIAMEQLIPADSEEHQKLLMIGMEELESRGLLLTQPDGSKQLDPLLIAVSSVIMRPEVAIVSVREVPAKGTQIFLHYKVGDYIAEQTFPEKEQHRIGALNDVDALFARLLAIFPVVGPVDGEGSATLSQEHLFAVRTYAQEGHNAEGVSLLEKGGMVSAAAHALVEAMSQPIFSGTVALLRCNDVHEIIDARNPAIVQGRQGAWCIAQAPVGTATFQIIPVNQATLQTQLRTWVAELSS